jgi:ACGX-repeat protein
VQLPKIRIMGTTESKQLTEQYFLEVILMGLFNLFGWNKKTAEAPAAACGAAAPAEKPAACGSACGAGDKPAEAPAACGAAAPEEKPAACGSACGAGDK